MNLKKARIFLGLTQRALAKKAGISRTTIMRAEIENKWPTSPLTRQKYAWALGIKI